MKSSLVALTLVALPLVAFAQSPDAAPEGAVVTPETPRISQPMIDGILSGGIRSITALANQVAADQNVIAQQATKIEQLQKQINMAKKLPHTDATKDNPLPPVPPTAPPDNKPK
jgi:TolA-binding protein